MKKTPTCFTCMKIWHYLPPAFTLCDVFIWSTKELIRSCNNVLPQTSQDVHFHFILTSRQDKIRFIDGFICFKLCLDFNSKKRQTWIIIGNKISGIEFRLTRFFSRFFPLLVWLQTLYQNVSLSPDCSISVRSVPTVCPGSVLPIPSTFLLTFGAN